MNPLDIILHLDKYLATIIQAIGGWTYALLFLIIFLETGLVITPFLPGDSLLFAAGAFASLGVLNIFLLWLLLILAAVLGDSLNYLIGDKLGPAVFTKNYGFLFRKDYLDRTHAFFAKHGKKTIILARFVPIIRTFAPFVAGIGKMHYTTFLKYNIIGGITWVTLFVWGGYYFGNIPIVQQNFSIVIIAIIIISIIPLAWEFIKARRAQNAP